MIVVYFIIKGYLVLIFEWQFFATLIQAVTVMEISFIETRFARTHTLLIC